MLALLLLLAAPVDSAPLLMPVHAWVEAFNRWDFAYPEAAFTEDAVVLDQFPTFLWQGKGSARTWWTALMGATEEVHEKRRVSQQHLQLGAPEFVQVKDSVAFFVQQGTLTWMQGGVHHRMQARWIATEVKTQQGWRISSHAWAPVSEE